MKRFNVIKRIAVTFTTVACIAVLFSSCHRGYGCPGGISDQEITPPQQEMTIVTDDNC